MGMLQLYLDQAQSITIFKKIIIIVFNIVIIIIHIIIVLFLLYIK